MLTTFDLVIIGFYLAGVVVLGIACRGRQENVNDFFTSSGRMGGGFASVMVGLSLAATLFSGISFIGYPGIVYLEGAKTLFLPLSIFLAWPILVFWFLPRYLGMGYTQPYEPVERAYGTGVRTVAAVLFIGLRIGWMSTLIYAPTIALMGAADLDMRFFWPIAGLIGAACTVYTVYGGIRGVIVTDAVQFIIIFGGVLFTLLYALSQMGITLGDGLEMLRANDKLQAPAIRLDFSDTLSLWAIVLGVFVPNLGNYVADQMALQRYLATENLKATIRSFSINMIGAVSVIVLLAVTGLTVWLWYHVHPDPNLPKDLAGNVIPDKIFPYFMANLLPSGLAGLLLAAILAATMSSMTSGINALASTITFDFRRRIVSQVDPKRELRFARVCSAVIGVLATLIAGFVGKLGTVFEITQVITGSFLGPLIVCIFGAVIGMRVPKNVLIIAMAMGCLSGWIVALATPASKLWVGPASLFVTFLIVWTGQYVVFSMRHRQ